MRKQIFFGLSLLLLTPIKQIVWASELPDPLEAGWQEQQVCERLKEDEYQRILRCTFPPGVGHERHYHVAHFGYALSGGKVEIIDDRGTRQVELADDSYYESDGVEWHQIKNIGDSTIVYLIIEKKE
jgi:quercetin dioxygenase-like cupin family protein